MFCRNCGNPHYAEDNFCVKCGKELKTDNSRIKNEIKITNVSIEKQPPDKSEITQFVDTILLSEDGIDLKQYLEEIEKSIIKKALSRTGNVKNQAAALLGLNRTTLVEKIKKLEIENT